MRGMLGFGDWSGQQLCVVIVVVIVCVRSIGLRASRPCTTDNNSHERHIHANIVTLRVGQVTAGRFLVSRVHYASRKEIVTRNPNPNPKLIPCERKVTVPSQMKHFFYSGFRSDLIVSFPSVTIL